MLRGLYNRWNRDKFRNAELQAIIAEADAALDISTEALASAWVKRDELQEQLEELRREYGDKWSGYEAKISEVKRVLSGKIVEATNKGMEFEEKSRHFEKLNSNQARTIKELQDRNDVQAASIKEYMATVGYLRDELRANEETVKRADHRISLAVHALTRDVGARPLVPGEVRVEMETSTLN